MSQHNSKTRTNKTRTVTRRFFGLTVAFVAFFFGALSTPVSAGGATQVGGTISAFDCNAMPNDYAFRIDGSLEGCVYGTITESRSHPSGTYQEVADEIFVGTYNGEYGTFEMTEFYTEKRVDGVLVFARCKHPIVTGSGTGVFEGVSGRLDFKDDVVAGTSVYKGHLRF